MLNPAHILEIALLLLVAFLVGATVGSLVRLAVSRLIGTKATTPVVATSAPVDLPVTEAAPALVAAPVIGEVVKTPMPTAPTSIPAPDFTEALLALAGDKPGSLATKIRMPTIAPLPSVSMTKTVAEMAPARTAGETTSGRLVAHPRANAEPAREISADATSADVIPFPMDKAIAEEAAVAIEVAPEPSAPPVEAVPVDPVNEPPAKAEAVVDPIAEVVAAQAAAELQAEIEVEAEAEAEAEVKTDAEIASATEVLVEAPVKIPVAAAADTVEPADVQQVSPLPELVVAVTPTPSGEDDEAAAMRAIEGNWSPRRGASARARKAALPEVAADEAVAALGAAVASAAEAASRAVAIEPAEEPGRPSGIAEPRLGVKDDLTHVIGILPIIETALNRLGLYHFDQIAELSDENAGWIENHLGIAGRIGREHWREQAREIASAMARAKKVAGKQ